MLFAALMVSFLVFRIESSTWPPSDFLRVPFWLTWSTLMLLSSAFTMRQTLHALRRWEQPRGVRYLALVHCFFLSRLRNIAQHTRKH